MLTLNYVVVRLVVVAFYDDAAILDRKGGDEEVDKISEFYFVNWLSTKVRNFWLKMNKRNGW